MKVFTNDTDTVVCESIDDVESVIKEVCGYSFADEGMSIDDWIEVPGDQSITICNMHDNGPDDKETHTAAEWAKIEGRGFLCSTEW